MREAGRIPGAALATLVLAGSLAAAPRAPLGRILWTSQEGGEFTLMVHHFLPPGFDRARLPALPADGVVRLDPEGRIAARGDELRARGAIDAQAPLAELRLAHPGLDARGLRPLWVEGRTWGPRAAGAAAAPVDMGTMALRLGGAAEPLTRPPETGFDAFPGGTDEDGRLYFARFAYRAGPDGVPGWTLFMRAPGGEAAPVLDADGAPVAGYEPQLSPDGAFLFFVRADPENVGSDLFVLPLAPRGRAELLVAGEGPEPRPTLGDPAESWMDYARRRGKARVSHPTLSGDGAFVAWATDLDGDFDLMVAPLAYPEPGRVVLAAPPVPVADSGPGEGAQDAGPSLSGDGAWLACQSDRAEPAGTGRAAGTRIWIVRNPLVPGDEGPAWVRVPGQPEGAEGLWPRWDQDEDPPHLQVELRPQDGSEPLRLRLVDREPDRRPGLEVAELSLQAAAWHPDTPAPGRPARPDLAPVAIGFEAGPGLAFEFGRPARGGSAVGLLLAGALDEAFPLPPLGRMALEGGAGFEHPVLTRPDFVGLATFEDVRLSVTVRARDDRWLRVEPTGADAALPAAVEARAFPADDPRAMAERPLAPWFPVLSREELEAGLPGVGWWVEERLGPGPVAVSHDSARELVFRSPDPEEEGPIGVPPRLLRVLAQDLLGNRTEVAIPIRVRPKDFGVRTLESTGRRQG